MSKFIYPLKCKERTSGAMNEEKRACTTDCILHFACSMFNKAPTSKHCAAPQSVNILYSEDRSGDHFFFFLLHLSSYGWLWCTFSHFAPESLAKYRPEVLRRSETLSVREESAIFLYSA